jgi:hypothetical protein
MQIRRRLNVEQIEARRGQIGAEFQGVRSMTSANRSDASTHGRIAALAAGSVVTKLVYRQVTWLQSSAYLDLQCLDL